MTDDDEETTVDGLRVLWQPWVFTQTGPLPPEEFSREAKKLGFSIDARTLRELHRHGLLSPMFEVRAKRVSADTAGEPPVDPPIWNTWRQELIDARNRNRVLEPARTGHRQRLRFSRRPGDARNWWSGLLYSRYQLVALQALGWALSNARPSRDGALVRITSNSHQRAWSHVERFSRIALAATALEARYRPVMFPEWVRITGVLETSPWYEYRDQFDPHALAEDINYSPDQARDDAEWLLSRVHAFEPMGAWWRLAALADDRDGSRLSPAGRLAREFRETAEILIRFYEDATDSEISSDPAEYPSWHPWVERFSRRSESLDHLLTEFGLSPHPAVVLLVEGETEGFFFRSLRSDLKQRQHPDLIHLVEMRGKDADLQRLASFAGVPLLGREFQGGWQVDRRPSRLAIWVDPDGRWDTPAKVERERLKLVNEIRAAIEAQGGEATEASTDGLVAVHTWQASCFEFEHFTDLELAKALKEVHRTCNGLGTDELETQLAKARQQRRDIKSVWSRWTYKPSKTQLAEALLPTMRAKVRDSLEDPSIAAPPIAELMAEVYEMAIVTSRQRLAIQRPDTANDT